MEKQLMKQINSVSVAIALFAVLVVSAGAYFCNIDACSHKRATNDVRPAVVLERVSTPARGESTAISEKVVPVKNEPTLAPMVFLPPQPNGQVVCVEVQVEHVVSGSGN